MPIYLGTNKIVKIPYSGNYVEDEDLSIGGSPFPSFLSAMFVGAQARTINSGEQIVRVYLGENLVFQLDTSDLSVGGAADLIALF